MHSYMYLRKIKFLPVDIQSFCDHVEHYMEWHLPSSEINEKLREYNHDLKTKVGSSTKSGADCCAIVKFSENWVADNKEVCCLLIERLLKITCSTILFEKIRK